jgi:hypothetical protein
MATTNPVSETAPTSLRSGASLLVVAAAMPPQQLESILGCLALTIPADELIIATPNGFAAEAHPSLRVVNFPTTNIAWRITAADFISAYQLAQKNDARGIVMLGPESGSLNSQGLCDLANAVLGGSADLAMPRYDLPPHAALVNSAILYPLTRALFACRTRFPLGIDLGLSLRMAERLAGVAQRFSTLNQEDALLWPVSEALVAGYTVDEFAVGPRDLPQPPAELNINAILALVTGSLFADIEAKAAFWQRPRRLPPARYPIPEVALADGTSDIVSMIDAFRLAYTNLLEIWSLVLPPNTLLGLKRLSLVDAAAFRMPENLWARIVYDFLIAYRLRTINRGHLLGALIPLYLAWVAGHINITASGTSSERHIEAVAAAFEADKPYLVARWRWPDRFNS